ncbi:MAG: hypothetical protein GX365_01830 [Clostridiales bacterium]|nr:hypothetical protein [Clostridiales bacterium]
MKKNIMTIITTILVCVLAVGCSGKTDSSSGGRINNKEILDTASSNLLIDGVAVATPFCLNDLGEGFKYDKNRYFSETEKGDYYLVTYIMHDDVMILEVQIYGLTEEHKTNEELLNSTNIDYISSELALGGEITFGGVSVGDDITVLSDWGEPSEKKEGFIRFKGYDENKLKGTLSFTHSRAEEEKIDKISLFMYK